jgi:hypothetical protein
MRRCALALQRVVVGAAVGHDLLEERRAVAVLRVREDHGVAGDLALVQVAETAAVARAVADVLDGERPYRELVLGAHAELIDDRRVLVRVLDAPLHDRRFTVCALSGVKPWAKVSAGASLPVSA